jgi:hypothetical protein
VFADPVLEHAGREARVDEATTSSVHEAARASHEARALVRSRERRSPSAE